MEDSKELFKKRKLHNKPPQFRGVVRSQENKKEPMVEVPKEETVIETPVVTKWKEDAPEHTQMKEVNVVKSVPEELSGFRAQKELGEKAVEENKLAEPVDEKGSFVDRIPEPEEKAPVWRSAHFGDDSGPERKEEVPPLPLLPAMSASPVVVPVVSHPVVEQPVSRITVEPVLKGERLVFSKKPIRIKIMEMFGSALATLGVRPPLPPIPAGVEPPGQVNPEVMPVSKPIGPPANEVLKKIISERNNPKV